MQLLWHRITAVSWWRSFQSLGFPVLSWQQLLSWACWNPFSHSVNAMHRKVGCFHQSPSHSEICLIENREGCCNTMDLAYFPRTWPTCMELTGKVWRVMTWKHNSDSWVYKYNICNKDFPLVANDKSVILELHQFPLLWVWLLLFGERCSNTKVSFWKQIWTFLQFRCFIVHAQAY